MTRLLAPLIGLILASAVFGIGWRMLHPSVPMQDVELRVTDSRGTPIESFRWEYRDWTQGAVFSPYVPQKPQHPGGVAIARVPCHDVDIEIRAKGYARAQLGRFEPTTIPRTIDVTLQDLKAVTGMVTSAGKPVSEATVALVHPGLDLIDGVPSGLVSTYDYWTTVTDERGSFRIQTENEREEYLVRASKTGVGVGTAGPARVEQAPIDVQLREGGSIEGTLRLADGKNPTGAEVELYRVDPYHWEVDPYGHFPAACDEQGRFRFEHVESGSWLVRLRPPKPDNNGRLSRSPEFVPFVVEVVEGTTSSLEMDLAQKPLRLEGRPRINGKPWTNAYFVLHLAEGPALILDGVGADEDGTWTLRVRSPGQYRLVVWGNHEHDTSVPSCVSDLVQIPQTGAAWDINIAWDPHSADEFRLDRTPR